MSRTPRMPACATCCALSAAPIIASHSSARALTNHARNLSDELMRSIAAKGGAVQIVAYTGFLKLDPARDAAEKALENEIARQAGDAEFDSAKHEYLPAYIAGLERARPGFSARDARRLPGSHPARRERRGHRSCRARVRLRWRRRQSRAGTTRARHATSRRVCAGAASRRRRSAQLWSGNLLARVARCRARGAGCDGQPESILRCDLRCSDDASTTCRAWRSAWSKTAR